MSNSVCYFIYSPCVETSLNQLMQHQLINELGIELRKISLADVNALHVAEHIAHALVWVDEQAYEKVLLAAQKHSLSLGFLPIKNGSESLFFKSIDLPYTFDECLQLALLKEDAIPIDLIRCNDQLVTGGIHLTNQATMDDFIGNPNDDHFWIRVQFEIKRFFHAFALHPHPVTLTTAKGKVISTAITDLSLLDLDQNSRLAKLFGQSVSLRDKRLSVALFSPQSILGYLTLSTQRSFRRTGQDKLPPQFGYIRTQSLIIKSPLPTKYYVNNDTLVTDELHLEILEPDIQVTVSKAFKESPFLSDDKENVSCEQLPQNDAKVKYLQSSLPFFPHASEADFKDLFLALKDSAKTTDSFILLMVLSSLLATLGLFLNSPSVVIGAMVLAPLMSPIISLSMGLLRADNDLSKQSFYTLFIGMFIALSLSASMAAIFPFHNITNEIAGRLNPTTLDLFVAILSGVAGAFANSRENIAKSLPGVAIAVALVPPLCVSGIGIGWMNEAIFLGAMLLFVTNLAGIILAAGLSFMMIGFAPFSRAKKGIFLSSVVVAIISIPLILSFQKMERIASIRKNIVSEVYMIDGEEIKLRNVSVQLGTPIILTADLLIGLMPSSLTIMHLEQELAGKLQSPVHFDFSIHLVSDVVSTKL